MTAAWHVFFSVTKDELALIDNALGEFFDAVVIKPVRENDPTSLETIAIIFPREPDRDAVLGQLTDIFTAFGLDTPALKIEALPDIDWLQHVYDSIPPIDAGRFFIHGAHNADQVPPHRIAVVIEAASAFGTGEHPTTKGCLLLLDELLKDKTPQRLLDMGTGSGILAIAAAVVLPETEVIAAVDIDLNSVRVAKNHAVDNGVAHRILFQAGDGCRAPLVAEKAPYDLVLANILAQPLMDMAANLTAAATGDIILSGFTDEQLPYVEKAYVKNGCTVVKTHQIEKWMALWLRKN